MRYNTEFNTPGLVQQSGIIEEGNKELGVNKTVSPVSQRKEAKTAGSTLNPIPLIRRWGWYLG